jgi:VWFA-related protein
MKATVRKLAIPAIILFAATGVGFAQNLTEKIDVNLVNVDVTVTSHSAPARGLTRDDFEVLEDGVPQSITNFYAIENTRDSKSAAANAPQTATSVATPASRDARFRRKVLVIIDNRHMTVHNRDVALNKLEQFINDRFDSGSYDWSVAMIGDRAHLLLPLTSDKERIHGALAEIRNAAAGSMRDTYQVENRTARITPEANIEWIRPATISDDSLRGLVEQSNRLQAAADAATTYGGLLEVTRSFANAPGRKIILLMTGEDIFFDVQENALLAVDKSLATRFNAGLTQLHSWLVREANASDVSISIVDTEGLTPNNIGADAAGGLGGRDFNGADFASMDVGLRRSGGNAAAAFYWLARQTGGESFTGNYIEKSLRDFDVASSNFYSLAYRPNHPEDSKYHSITVRLKNPGRSTLSYRTGYRSLPIEAQIERAMQSTMVADMQPSSLSLKLLTGSVMATDVPGVVVVPFTAVVSAKELQFIPTTRGPMARVDIFVSLFNDDGHLLSTFRTVQEAHATDGTEGKGNFVTSDAVRLRKGKSYRLVVAVHDQVSDSVGIQSQSVRF